MSVSFYNMEKWVKMLTGRSILHVNQGVGKIYSKSEIKGYYNDLTEKVTRDKDKDKVKLPAFKTKNGSEVLFPIMIFQYGLGAYDLFLIENDQIFLKKFKLCADWALDNQQNNGSWNTFFFIYPDAPYSAMAQGEGISLLLRAYIESNHSEYLIAAKKAVDFMILPVEDGGTAKYLDEQIFCKEYTNLPTVLNGWIFSLFGLYDYWIVTDDEKIKTVYDRSIQTLIDNLASFDNGFWSKYNTETTIASPFYHKLHLAQLKVMYDITGEKVFIDYYQQWEAYEKNKINYCKAFTVKALQKICEE